MPVRSPFMVNFFVFAGFSSIYPFLVLYYQELGFTGAQIGLLTGVTPLITLFSSPFWTGLSDKTRRHRLVMGFLMLSGAGLMFAFPVFQAFLPVLILSILFNIFFAPTNAFTDTATMHMLGERKELYGRIRLGGTIGFGLAAPFAGILVERYGLPAAFWAAGLLFLAGFIFSRKLVFEGESTSEPVALNLGKTLRSPRWIGFLAIALAGGLGFSATGTYFYPYLGALGTREAMMGVAVAVGTIAEIPVMFFGDRLLKRFSPYPLLLLAMAFTVARLLLFALNTSPLVALIIQLLNGLAFPMMWVAGVAYADLHAPPQLKASVQGLFGAMIFGVGSALGGFLGGLLLESNGPRILYLVFGLSVLGVSAVGTFFSARTPNP